MPAQQRLATFGARGSDGGVIIDAVTAVRNLAAFINFSCGGAVCNLKAESVKAEHRDRSFPKVAFTRPRTSTRAPSSRTSATRSDEPEEPLEGAVRVCARGVNGQVLFHGYL